MTEKKKFEIPHIFVILALLALVVAVITYMIPAGEYVRIEGADGRAIIDPNSFHLIEKTPTTFLQYLKSFPQGLVDSGWLFVLTFTIGGAFGVIKKAINISALIKMAASKFGRFDIFMIISLMIIIALIDSFIGMCELTIVYVPILLPLILALGYDSITCCGLVLGASVVGFASAMTNPFTTAVAQKICNLPLYSGISFRFGILIVMLIISTIYVIWYSQRVKKAPEKSFTYQDDKETKKIVLSDETENVKLTTRESIAGFITLAGFILTVFGVIKWGWDMPEMGGCFVGIAIFSGIISGMNGNEICNNLIEGFKEVLVGALVIGVARAITVIMSNANITDTIVYYLSSIIQSVPASITSIGMLIFQTIFNFFVPSGSGQATIVMPLMSPLAELCGITQQTAVLAFQFGDGLSNVVYPVSGYMMATLAVGHVPYNKWLKFILPLFAILTIVSAIILVVAQSIQLGPF